MRIIAGSNKGRYLKVPKQGTRPTRGMIRQAIFDVLRGVVRDARVLDMFAGSGAMGIEALSRGALSCVFVEKNPGALRSNIQALGLPRDRVMLLSLDFRFALRRLAGTEFDLTFIDPPYRRGYLAIALELMIKYGLIQQAGMIVAEHQSDEKPSIPELAAVKEKKYGATVISFFARRGNEKSNICRNI